MSDRWQTTFLSWFHSINAVGYVYSCLLRLGKFQVTVSVSLGFMINGKASLFCVLIYRPTKYSSDVIQKFSDLLAFIYCQVVRWFFPPSFPIYFIDIVHSFNLALAFEGPTHVEGNILETVLVLFKIVSISVRLLCLTKKAPQLWNSLPENLRLAEWVTHSDIF